MQRTAVGAVPLRRHRDEIGAAHGEQGDRLREAHVLAQQHADAADRGVQHRQVGARGGPGCRRRVQVGLAVPAGQSVPVSRRYTSSVREALVQHHRLDREVP